MPAWAFLTTDVLWRNGLTAIPLVLLTTAVCRWIPCRPATRHTMWLVVLTWLVTPTFLPEPPTPKLVSGWVAPLPPLEVADADPIAGSVPGTVATIPPQKPVATPRTRPRRSSHPLFMKLSPEPAKKPALVHSESSPIPSPRIAARTVSRSPDVLAQATGTVGPLSAPTAEKVGLSHFAGPPLAKNSGGDSTVAPFVAQRRSASPQRPETPLHPENEARPEGAVGRIDSTIPLMADGPNWRAWAAGIFAVRDAVTKLPSLPMTVWVGGTALLVLVGGLRVLQFRRHLRRALPAPESVTLVVETACQEMRLRRVPETLMVDGRLSPMIWCGLRPRLILPVPLWSQLDGPGRRAVVFHELAHVRRWDHWVSWLDQIIGSLYWWHPLVWWARRRLHAEAEVCCDAWVTSLLPQTRRAYAEALLVTRQYVAEENRPVPALGIGVTTGRARRFARRLTMVMTESVKPRLSASGFALVLMMATTGWLASPAKSCPDEDKAAKAASKGGDKPCATPCAKATTAVAPTPGSTPSAAATPAPAAKAGGATTYEQHMANRGHDGPGDAPEGGFVAQPGRVLPTIAIGRVAPFALAAGRGGDDQEERLNRLEGELERLGEQLERLTEALGDRDEAHSPGVGTSSTPRPPRAARAPRAPQPGQPLMAPLPPMPPMPAMPAMPGQPPMPPGVGFGPGPSEGHDGGEVHSRAYSLSQGKLEALTQLMSRSDVPILVRRQENALEVQATDREHRIFAAFVRMIDPTAERRGDSGVSGDDGDRHVAANRRRIAKEMERAAKQRAKAIEKLEKHRAKTGARMEEIKIEATVKAETQEALEREAESLSEQAERLAEQAEEVRERTERIEHRAGRESERDKRADLEREVLALRHQAEALELQKNQLEDRAHAIEDRAREAEDQARETENRLEQLEEELRQAEQEAAEEDDDGSHASVDNPGSEWWSSLQPAIEAAVESLTGLKSDDDDADAPGESESDDD